jgi:hypothetical protein
MGSHSLDAASKGPVMTQQFPTARKTNRILEALLSGEHLTVALALQRHGVFALSQECGRLRRLGWQIESRTVETPGAHVSEYWLTCEAIPFCGYC